MKETESTISSKTQNPTATKKKVPRVNFQAPTEDDNSSASAQPEPLSSTRTMGEMDPTAFVDMMMARLNTTLDAKLDVIRTELERQDDTVYYLQEDIDRIKNKVEELTTKVEALQQAGPSPVQYSPSRPNTGILHVTGWPLNDQNKPWFPDNTHVGFDNFREVVADIEHTGGDSFIINVFPPYTYWAPGKALALNWQNVRQLAPQLDIRSRRERNTPGTTIESSRFHRCTKTWEQAKNGNARTRNPGFPLGTV
eukprot:Mrub_03274.p1 GENE.Mrub_03274~~Mrub_03274.p1  ORF type:complete len:253 (+),score=76.72 Mrub_03274:708-1466(+)